MFPLVLIALALAAREPKPAEERPVCDADTVGLMWPNEANLDAGALHKLARSGELWLCTRGPWSYKWERPSVSVAQLRKEREPRKQRKPAAATSSQD